MGIINPSTALPIGADPKTPRRSPYVPPPPPRPPRLPRPPRWHGPEWDLPREVPPLWIVPPPDLPVGFLDPYVGYELYATIEGVGVPFDYAQAARALIPGLIEYHLLGGYSGDRSRGFRLSGPYGRIFQAGVQTGQPPYSFGLPAFVGAYFSDGIRILNGGDVNDTLGAALVPQLGKTKSQREADAQPQKTSRVLSMRDHKPTDKDKE